MHAKSSNNFCDRRQERFGPVIMARNSGHTLDHNQLRRLKFEYCRNISMRRPMRRNIFYDKINIAYRNRENELPNDLFRRNFELF